MSMKVYIAGPITGHPVAVYTAAFAAAEARLQAAGYTTVNPVTLPHDHGRTWAEYMKESLCAMLTCQAVYLMPGWEHSRGAKIEFNLARQLGFEILY